MEDKVENCRSCKKPYQTDSTSCDLCEECVKIYPFFLSFIEEGFVGVMDKIFGRVEVYIHTEEYDIEELRFVFTASPDREKAYRVFREKWDFEYVSKKDLIEVKKIIKSKFCDE
jgi:hypothetical protein